MNILLIGNGFDLAHKLPTQYKDFLDFCKKIEEIFVNAEEIAYNKYDTFLKEWKANFASDSINNGTFTTNYDILSQILPIIKDNLWLEYFWNCPTYIGENWIDFESEISSVVQIIDEIRNMTIRGTSVTEVEDKYKADILLAIIKASNKTLKEAFQNVKSVDKLIALLDDDLEKLIRVLEIYLTEFVGKIKNDVIVPEIETLDIDCVLSFNYTDIFENKYGADKKIDYNYVHGQAKLSNTIESNNMVLGIDEYLPEDRKDKEFALLSFKKFYQRLIKSTDNIYLDWADEIKDGHEDYIEKEKDAFIRLKESIRDGSYNLYPYQSDAMLEIEYPWHTLYIFGHSLDVTDKDILKLFICNDNVETKIFYYRRYEEDKTVLGKLITNLIGIIGQDELLRRTGGKHKTIEFIPQSIVKE